MLEFVCPGCGAGDLLEVRTGCTVVSEVKYVDSQGEIDYAPEPSVSAQEQDRMYQCAQCGWALQGVDSVRGLVDWMRGKT